jgi:bleomycin hydrolase
MIKFVKIKNKVLNNKYRNMKKTILLVWVLSIAMMGFSQKKDTTKTDKGYQFTVVKQLPTTSVKNQYRAGTCWSYSTISFLESELLRMGKGEHDLSEMWIVRHTYNDKAEKYVRMHGILNFSQGGAFHDVTAMIKKYGIVPQEVYQGLNYGTKKDVHGELEAILKGMIDAVVENKNRKITPVWMAAYNKVLDTYFGEEVKDFEYNGKKYTPKSFAKDLGLDADNYVEITSYTHHPFYKKFAIEVQDNWMWDECYNVPIDEMMKIMDDAIQSGYTIAWGADVSEKGFSWNNGVAIIPEESKENLADNEQSKWSELTERQRKKLFYSFEGPVKEKVITQEMRQEGFDNYTTTDDHGMHITGIAKDQKGNKYYIVKNSWSEKGNDYKGYFYASEAFVKYKTMDFMIHKDALSKDMKKKLQIK